MYYNMQSYSLFHIDESTCPLSTLLYCLSEYLPPPRHLLSLISLQLSPPVERILRKRENCDDCEQQETSVVLRTRSSAPHRLRLDSLTVCASADSLISAPSVSNNAVEWRVQAGKDPQKFSISMYVILLAAGISRNNGGK